MRSEESFSFVSWRQGAEAAFAVSTLTTNITRIGKGEPK